MVRLFKYAFILIYSVPAFHLLGQSDYEIHAKQNELKIIKDEISLLEKKITNKSKKEKETYSLLQDYDKQSFLLNKIITNYRIEEKKKQNQISTTRLGIKSLTDEISQLQNNYAKYVDAIYRKGKQSELAQIFDSESISEALRRMFYLKKFSERREKDLLNFERSKNELSTLKIKLEKEKAEKTLLLEKKMKEEELLGKKTNERKQILNNIKKNKAEFKKELQAKKKAEALINDLIVKLIEEKAKRERETKEKMKLAKEEKIVGKTNGKSKSTDKNESSDEDIPQKNSTFENLKGNLIWPVIGGKVIRKFGENKNLILNTITLNYGVDIKVTNNLNVRSVAEGTISAIEWIPGYGSIIIINHADNYRTVYGHLSDIYVQEREKVNYGQSIASVSESIEGYVLHFEIWNSRKNQNPEIWLVKK